MKNYFKNHWRTLVTLFVLFFVAASGKELENAICGVWFIVQIYYEVKWESLEIF
jgi:hypothetical protein